MDQLVKRYHYLEQNSRELKLKIINQVQDRRARQDLLKMLQNFDRFLVLLSKESIECRRHQKITSKFNDLETQAKQAFENVEKHLILARLIYG